MGVLPTICVFALAGLLQPRLLAVSIRVDAAAAELVHSRCSRRDIQR